MGSARSSLALPHAPSRAGRITLIRLLRRQNERCAPLYGATLTDSIVNVLLVALLCLLLICHGMLYRLRDALKREMHPRIPRPWLAPERAEDLKVTLEFWAMMLLVPVLAALIFAASGITSLVERLVHRNGKRRVRMRERLVNGKSF